LINAVMHVIRAEETVGNSYGGTGEFRRGNRA
jgi:hypothetical protein